MKLFSLYLFSIFILNAHSQDVIFLSKTDSILSKVLDVSSQNTRYKMYGNVEGPQYLIPSSSISHIRYQSGIIDSLKWIKANVASNIPIAQVNLDVDQFYIGYRLQQTKTFFITAFTGPFFGILFTAAAFKTEVDSTKFVALNKTNLSDPKYVDGYKKMAKIKQDRKITKAYLGGVLAHFLAIAVALLSLL